MRYSSPSNVTAKKTNDKKLASLFKIVGGIGLRLIIRTGLDRFLAC